MKRRQIILTLILAAVLVHLIIQAESAIHSYRNPAPETLGHGRTQSYREIEGRGGYRVFENTGADEVGVTDPYGDYADRVAEAEAEMSGEAEEVSAGSRAAGPAF